MKKQEKELWEIYESVMKQFPGIAACVCHISAHFVSAAMDIRDARYFAMQDFWQRCCYKTPRPHFRCSKVFFNRSGKYNIAQFSVENISYYEFYEITVYLGQPESEWIEPPERIKIAQETRKKYMWWLNRQ